MSMDGYLKHISPWLLEKLKAKSDLVEPFVVALPPAGDHGLSAEAMAEVVGGGELDDIKKEMVDIIKELAGNEATTILKEIKSAPVSIGDLINVLRTKGGPLNKDVLRGPEIGDDLGYGPAQFLSPSHVAALSSTLDNASDSDLKAVITTKNPEEAESALGYVNELVSYFRKAAKKKHAMLVYFS